ncbi:MAG: hypothetical protein LBK47_06640 [Prevotellaceae bacterium]|jgi:hypothetical protein|nr:hypothetical protein [Prevotellaceae bacterium]
MNMKTMQLITVVAAMLMAVACSKDEAKDYTLDGVLSEVASNGTHAWVETNQTINDAEYGQVFNGKTYTDVSALVVALRAAGFTPDTSLAEGRIDADSKKFGCAGLRKMVYNFKSEGTAITTNYYTDECACLNATRSRYTTYQAWSGSEAGDAIYLDGSVHFNVTGFSKKYFEGSDADMQGRQFRFELIEKRKLKSAGLTKLDD